MASLKHLIFSFVGAGLLTGSTPALADEDSTSPARQPALTPDECREYLSELSSRRGRFIQHVNDHNSSIEYAATKIKIIESGLSADNPKVVEAKMLLKEYVNFSELQQEAERLKKRDKEQSGHPDGMQGELRDLASKGCIPEDDWYSGQNPQIMPQIRTIRPDQARKYGKN